MYNEGRGLAHQTLEGLSVNDPMPGKEVFTISVKSAVSWAISSLGNATPVADDNDEYPSYVSDLVAALYGGGVAVPDPVRAASLSQQHLVAKQIHTTIEQAKLGTMTKRRRDEVEFTHHLAKKIKTEGKYFRTTVTKVVEADEYSSPVHTDIAFSQSGTKFGFRTLVSDLGQGAHTHAKRFCTSCPVPHSIWNTEEVNLLLSDQHVPAIVPK